jgi:ribonuclease HI
MNPDDLWQQVYRVGDKFFVDLGGMFGSRNAGDAWQLVMEFIAICLRNHCNVPELRYFVDNGVNITPAKMGKIKAEADFNAIIEFLSKAGVPYHDITRPSTQVRFLGWYVNTDTMTVTCPPERLKWIRDVIVEDVGKISPKLVQSVTGLLEYLAAVLPFLRAPLGWLQRRAAAQEAGRELCDDEFRIRFTSYFKYIEDLLHDWNGSTSVYASVSTNNPDIIIYSDASGECGFGAIEVISHSFTYGKWSADEFKLAMRVASISSTHMEIMAIVKAVKTFAKRNSAVHVFADSAAAIYVLSKRYDKKSDHSQGLIIALDRYCRTHGISIFFSHVPRTNDMIQIVDQLSKDIVPNFLLGWEKVDFADLSPIIF